MGLQRVTQLLRAWADEVSVSLRAVAVAAVVAPAAKAVLQACPALHPTC